MQLWPLQTARILTKIGLDLPNMVNNSLQISIADVICRR